MRSVYRFFLVPIFLLLLYSTAASQANKGALFRSALLPGWGQHHMGYGTRGNVFLGLEIATWTGFGFSYLEGVLKRDDYRSMAMEEAGISARGRDHGFLEDLGDFNSSEEYNDYIRRLARYYYPDDPDRQREYYEDHARYGSDGWLWSSEAARLAYANMYRDSRQWFRRSVYVAAFALVNRAVSAIDAALLKDRDLNLYTSLSFPECYDATSVKFIVGASF